MLVLLRKDKLTQDGLIAFDVMKINILHDSSAKNLDNLFKFYIDLDTYDMVHKDQFYFDDFTDYHNLLYKKSFQNLN